MGIARYFDPKISDDLRLHAGILRKEVLKRDLDFRRQFFDWQETRSAAMLTTLRQNYEATFFDDETSCCVLKRPGHARVIFRQTEAYPDIRAAFLLDEFKDRSLAYGFHCFRAESWKMLHAEDGVSTHERYLLHNNRPGWFSYLFRRWLKGELLVLENIRNGPSGSALEIRLYPARNKPVKTNIHRLMGQLLSSGQF